MLVIIRSDASKIIGTGHIMRCLTLARRIKAQGAEVVFICRNLPGNLYEYIISQGLEAHLLPTDEDYGFELAKTEQPWEEPMLKEDAEQTIKVLKKLGQTIDWIIIDHYKIDHRWQSLLRTQVRNIMVIDDLANRRHDCDILLDQNYFHNIMDRYDGLVPRECSLFLGPRYLLLRDEFYQARKRIRNRTGEVSNILVSYGGADQTNETEKCLMVLHDYLTSGSEINVVIGHSNTNKERIKDICSSRVNTNYHYQISNIAELINKADLAFGAGGISMWERCLLGLPSIVTVTAENQNETTHAVSDLGAIWNLGWYEKVNNDLLLKAVKRVLMSPSKLLDMQKKALDLAGGRISLGIEQLVEALF